MDRIDRVHRVVALLLLDDLPKSGAAATQRFEAALSAAAAVTPPPIRKDDEDHEEQRARWVRDMESALKNADIENGTNSAVVVELVALLVKMVVDGVAQQRKQAATAVGAVAWAAAIGGCAAHLPLRCGAPAACTELLSHACALARRDLTAAAIDAIQRGSSPQRFIILCNQIHGAAASAAALPFDVVFSFFFVGVLDFVCRSIVDFCIENVLNVGGGGGDDNGGGSNAQKATVENLHVFVGDLVRTSLESENTTPRSELQLRLGAVQSMGELLRIL